MTFDEFTASLNDDTPPAGLSPYLTALWREKRGDWNAAHELVQDIETREAAAIHAYLHRREGDIGNAQYWYRRAQRPAKLDLALDEEWGNLVQELL
jgi:phage gp29-like protein